MRHLTVFVICLLAFVCVAPQAHAQCNGAAFSGTWGFSLTGSEIFGSSGNPLSTQVSVAGVFTILPTGALQVTASTNGNILQTGVIRQESFFGQYTITTTGPSANLGGTITLKSASVARANYDFYCGAFGNELFLISTDASPLVLSGVARKVL